MARMHEPTGHTCVGCGEPILHGQSVVRVDASVPASPNHRELKSQPLSAAARKSR